MSEDILDAIGPTKLEESNGTLIRDNIFPIVICFPPNSIILGI